MSLYSRRLKCITDNVIYHNDKIYHSDKYINGISSDSRDYTHDYSRAIPNSSSWGINCNRISSSSYYNAIGIHRSSVTDYDTGNYERLDESADDDIFYYEEDQECCEETDLNEEEYLNWRNKMMNTIFNKEINKYSDIIKNKIYRKADKYINNTIKSKLIKRYGYYATILDANGKFEAINKFIQKYDKNYSNRNKVEYVNTTMIMHTEFIFKIDINTYVYIDVGSDDIDDIKYISGNYCENMKIFIFGKYYKKYAKEFEDVVNNAGNNFKTNSLYNYNIIGIPEIGINNGSSNPTNRNGSYKNIAYAIKHRTIDTLFYNNDIEKRIINHIQYFLDNKQFYKDRDINYKTGILLYGNPGTGKTSLIAALANYFNFNTITIDMNTFQYIDIAKLSGSINADNFTYIVVMEDIDTVFNIDRESELDKDDKKVVNKLLQFLDSNISPDNVIIIATTNHIDKLDSAILRSGRFDIKVNIDDFDLNVARKMCNSFKELSSADTDEIIKHIKDFHNNSINPSELQNIIIDKIKENKLNNSCTIETSTKEREALKHD